MSSQHERVPDLRPRYDDGDRFRFSVLAARAWANWGGGYYGNPPDGLVRDDVPIREGQLLLRIRNFRNDRLPDQRFGDIPCLPYEVIVNKEWLLLERLCKIEFITVHRRPADTWGTWPLQVIEEEKTQLLVYLPHVIAHDRGRFEIVIRSGTFRFGMPVRPPLVEFSPRALAFDYMNDYVSFAAFLEL